MRVGVIDSRRSRAARAASATEGGVAAGVVSCAPAARNIPVIMMYKKKLTIAAPFMRGVSAHQSSELAQSVSILEKSGLHRPSDGSRDATPSITRFPVWHVNHAGYSNCQPS